jgi:hypothetical protein
MKKIFKIEFLERIMADCPVCNSKLYTENAGFPFINFRRIFGCSMCGWKMDVSEVHRMGGLDRIKSDLGKKHSHHNKRHRKSHHRKHERR